MLCNNCFGKRRGILVKIQLGLNRRQIHYLKIYKYFRKKWPIDDADKFSDEKKYVTHISGNNLYVKLNSAYISGICEPVQLSYSEETESA